MKIVQHMYMYDDSSKLTKYSTTPKGSAFKLNNGAFIARHDHGCNQ